MNAKLALFAVSFLLVSAPGAYGQTGDLQGNPLEALDTIELDKMTVLGDKQVLALRIVKIGLENKRSHEDEDANKVVCYLDQPAGTYMTHLYCGTNEALDAWARASRSAVGSLIEGAAYSGSTSLTANAQANIYVSERPVSPGFIEEVLEKLGPSDLNREIVSHVLQGGEMPNNVPTEPELNRFLDAYLAVKEVRSDYDSRLAEASGDELEALSAEADAKMTAAISDAGLTVERYNAISAMTEDYPSLQRYLSQRITQR